MTQTTNTNYYQVTESQIAACTRITDIRNRRIFYLVRNSRGLTNDAGEIIEYKIIYNRLFGRLQCLPFNGPPCPASLEGTTCWHMRAALAAAAEFKAELKARQAETEATLQAIEANGLGDEISPYTEQVDPTSSSLDGIRFEMAPSGRLVPMR